MQIALDRADCAESLRDYVELAWPVLEPARPFVPGWHIDAVCEHLEAVSFGDITRLLINIPPGCMKSMLTDVFFPSWEWGPLGKAHMRYVCTSYSQDLTIRDNRKTRDLVTNDWYQKRWGHQFQLVSDQNAKIRFDTTDKGYKIATSMGGLGTGERGDRVIIDDPHNVIDGESDAKRNAVILWFSEAMTSRVNDPEESVIIVIMQRVHEHDMSGHIIAKELGYEHLSLPMEYEPDNHCSTSIGFSDPRADENQLLWPSRMTRTVVERDKKAMGSYATAGQYQQRPSPRGGGMFQTSWFGFVDCAPKGNNIVRAWDFAATEQTNKSKDPDWTAGVRMSMDKAGVIYIEHIRRFRKSPAEVESTLKATAEMDGKSCPLSMPQDPGQAGKAQKRHLALLLHGYDFSFSPETGSKELRAKGLAAQAEAGNVKIVRGAWNGDFLDEAEKFPHGKHDDQIDACSRAYAFLVELLGTQPDDLYVPGQLYIGHGR